MYFFCSTNIENPNIIRVILIGLCFVFNQITSFENEKQR